MPEFEAAACSLAAHRKKIEEQNKNNSGFGNVASSELKREIADNGAFVRQQNRFDTPFGNEEGIRQIRQGDRRRNGKRVRDRHAGAGGPDP